MNWLIFFGVWLIGILPAMFLLSRFVFKEGNASKGPGYFTDKQAAFFWGLVWPGFVTIILLFSLVVAPIDYLTERRPIQRFFNWLLNDKDANGIH